MPADDSHHRPPAPGLSWVHEVGEALLWTRLLRVPALAARPQRVVLSAFLLVLVSLLGGIRLPWRGDTPAFLDALLGAALDASSRPGRAILEGHPLLAAGELPGLLADIPARALTDYPLETFLLGIPIVLVLAVLAGAVCRSVACEFAQQVTHPWPHQLAFAVRRWRSLAGVVILPGALAGLIALLLAAAGVACFNFVPGLELVGALLYGLALLLGLAAVLILLLTALAWPMLIPAAVCEGSDAIDAAGRALAYALARPLRLVAYLLLAGSVCTVVGVLANAIAEGAISFTQTSLTAWTTDRGSAEVHGTLPHAAGGAATHPDLGPLAASSSWIIGLWSGCLRLLAASYALSTALTAGTLIYLFMRQLCDGQHYAELWTPGQIERAFEAAMTTAHPAPLDDDEA